MKKTKSLNIRIDEKTYEKLLQYTKTNRFDYVSTSIRFMIDKELDDFILKFKFKPMKGYNDENK